MRHTQSLVIEWNDDVVFPVFPPGALIAVFPEPIRTLARRRGRVAGRGGARRAGRNARARGRVVGRIRAGARCYALHVVTSRQRRRPGDAAVVTCRLTACVHPSAVPRTLARRITSRRIDAFLKDFRQRAPAPGVGRQLRLCVLLRLQVSRSATAADRRHPAVREAWQTWLRTERRRMLQRLRNAVRRLERQLER